MGNTQLVDAPSVGAGRSQFLTPQGRELVISQIKGTALYRINFADGQPGLLPDKYSGRYTKPEYAADDIKLCLKEIWSAYNAWKEQTAEPQVDAEDAQEVQEEVLVEPKRRGRPPKTVAPVPVE